MDTQNTLFEITPQNLVSLENLFRTQFFDLHKIISLFDSKLADEFKKLNGAFLKHHQETTGHAGEGCCGNINSKYYIPRDRMSMVDQVIDDKIFKSKTFYSENNHQNMIATLSNIDHAFKSI